MEGNSGSHESLLHLADLIDVTSSTREEKKFASGSCGSVLSAAMTAPAFSSAPSKLV